MRRSLLATPAGRALGPQALEAAVDAALTRDALANVDAVIAEKRRQLGL